MTISVLTIAGSDSGGGAGIQADLRTFAAHRVHGLSAITALTAQNTTGVRAVHVPDVGFLHEQIDACFDDFDVRCVKLGMLATAEVIHAVADALERHEPVPMVLDPVMVATSGARLLAADAVHAMRQRLLPLASIVTPNGPEAGVLLGHAVEGAAMALQAAEAFVAHGARSALVKGGHLSPESPVVVDVLAIPGSPPRLFQHPRLAVEAHGTGCTLASSIAACLAQGQSVAQACANATDYVHRALLGAYRPGRGGLVVLDHFGAAR